MVAQAYSAYHKHYERMLNSRPSTSIHEYDLDAYIQAHKYLASIRKDAPILDIGCGYGHQLYILKVLGYTNLHGIEISPESYKIAREELGTEAEIVFADAFEYLPDKREYYHVVFLNDVLEHIPKDKTIHLLKLIHDALVPGGYLSVRVPNMASLLASYSMYLDFTHVQGFTEFSLQQLFDIAGYTNHQIVHPVRRAKKFNLLRPLHGWGLTRYLNQWLHKLLYRLRAQTPVPTVFDYNIEIYTQKP